MILRSPASGLVSPIRNELFKLFPPKNSNSSLRSFSIVAGASSSCGGNRSRSLIPTQVRYASSSAAAAFSQSVDTFPSIVIGANGLISPQGPFAEAQAQVRN